ncbi:MAG TPA: VanZ family protein [Acidimicrobiales bacterium]|nr:VanZ family protein [Acidimicrobiales bacterium]
MRRLVRAAAVVFALAVAVVVLAPDPAFEGPARDVASSMSPRTPDPDPQPMQQLERIGWNRLDVLVNLLLFVPLGALVALGWKGPAWANAALAVVLAGLLEVLQLTVFQYRSAQLSDVLLNVAGSMLAFGAARSALRRRQPGAP